MKGERKRILGLMSGTSLDGLDLCLAEFEADSFTILKAETIGYDARWRNQLRDADTLSGLELARLDRAYGRFLGEAAAAFLTKHSLPKPDAIASHGHTIFHQPKEELTLQIGHGGALAAAGGFPVICDFRSLDVALGGQGAPLVPIGDLHLFKDYQACLNLGGFANISIKDAEGGIVAFDICACNIVLNHLAQSLGKEYDAGGSIAASGKVNPSLLKRLDKLSFYHESGPKSLGREWVVSIMLPMIEEAGVSPADAMRTLCRHVSNQIARIVKSHQLKSILVTGGGAHNIFLVELMKELATPFHCELIIPEKQTVDFKEALIFAYLGYRFLEGQSNTLASVTGASRDSVGGCLYKPNSV